MKIAILTFDGFDEIDVFLPFNLLNRLAARGWTAEIAAPSARVISAHGATVEAQRPLAFANEADAVIFAGTTAARALTWPLIDRLALDPLRQRIAGQSSGTLLLARLGLLGDTPACTDQASRRWLLEAGVRVHDGPFHAHGPVATAAGPMAAPCLAAWLIAHGAGLDTAVDILQQTAPIGDLDHAERTMALVRPFVTTG